MRRINKTQLMATPTVYGEDAKRILKSLQIKPTEQSKKNGEKLVEYFKKFENGGMSMIKKDVWYINCSTGCTCCSDQNFSEGFYYTEQEAKDTIAKYYSGIDYPLASQFARYGRYYISKTEAEILPDGRMIVEDRVYPENHFGHI